jgi:hypothetical protein
MSHFPRAFRQAQLRQLVCDWVYVSFPMKFARRTLVHHREELLSSGIGLLGVHDRRVRQILPASRSRTVDSSRRQTLIGMVTRDGAVNE